MREKKISSLASWRISVTPEVYHFRPPSTPHIYSLDSDSDISDISCLGKAVIAIGGGADLGAGQISVRDHEVEN